MSSVKTFITRSRKAYTECGKYISGRLPLTNKVLRILSSVDPRASGNISYNMSSVKETATCTLLELNIERIDAFVILNSVFSMV